MKKEMLDLLACPRCHGKLEYRRKQNELVCIRDRLAFPVYKGIPMLLEMDARSLDAEAVSNPGKQAE